MLYTNFNKFGGTELRYKFQVNVYYMIVNWLITQYEENDNKNEKEKEKEKKLKNFTSQEWLHEFKKWCLKEEIYKYGNEKINRFKMITSILINKIPILNKNTIYENGVEKEHYFFKNENILKDWEEIGCENFFFKYMQIGEKNLNKSFFEMLNFLKNNPLKNDSQLLAISFMVWDGKESFNDIYQMGIESIYDKISNQKYNLIIKNEKIDLISKIFRKSPKVSKQIEIIINQKNNNIDLKYEMFSLYDHKKDHYIKKIFFKKNEQYNLSKLIDRINKITLEYFIISLIKQTYKNNLEKEYLDLFNRWMCDFNISLSSSIKNNIYDSQKIGNLIYEEEQNYFELNFAKEEIKKFPFEKDQIISFLKKIKENDFHFKEEYKNLKLVPNSVIAEYFVNMYFCYFYSVKAKDFKKYSNTKVTEKLYPVFTAPGRVPDMCYYDDKIIHNIETTILSNKLEIEKHEIFSCLNHLSYSKEKYDNNKNKKIILSFIFPILKEEIKSRFFNNFDFEFKDSKIKELKLMNFNELDFIKKES